MNFKELQIQAIKHYFPALSIEQHLPLRFRTRLRRALTALVLVFLLAAGVLYAFISFSSQVGSVEILFHYALGAFFITLAFWMGVTAFQAFYYYYYFKDIKDEKKAGLPPLSFEVASIIYNTRDTSIVSDFFKHPYGRIVALRAGISLEDLAVYLESSKGSPSIQPTDLIFDLSKRVEASEYAGHVYDADPALQKFLFTHGLQKKDFVAVCEWMSERELSYKFMERWWSRGRLGRIPGIGKNWAYGQLALLEEYSGSIPYVSSDVFSVHDVYGERELKDLEQILVRAREANALLVGDDSAAKLKIVGRLNAMIDEGTTLPALKHKRAIMLNTNKLIAALQSKGDFELTFIKLMNEAVLAGNIILIMQDLPAFILSAQSLGSNIVSLLEPYFRSRDLQIIALSEVGQYQTVIEKNPGLMQHFEKITLAGVDAKNTIRILENEIMAVESRTGLFFTYPSIVAIAESAERYFSEGIMPDKAIDLLLEVSPKIAASENRVVTKDHILELIKTKTGIPVGQISQAEKDKLMNLESLLRGRIVGQNDAVVAISSAVRRARSGINNPNRPLASFLFLGPTGVGKTETTEALADVFFGTEAKIQRLDMSEYSGADAVAKLTGSFETSKPGILSEMIRTQQYGVLLLDEFEKTTPEVMNLFLQILDEGIFSDMAGKKVSARNLLIIATSNAGAQLMRDTIAAGKDLSKSKNAIIESIIKDRIFKPELLNRFDGVILFHPLAESDLRQIARLQLTALQKRLAEKSINLIITDELITYVMKYGTDPQFGARPMNRAIQDKVEQIIADKMIKGEIKLGGELRLTSAELV